MITTLDNVILDGHHRKEVLIDLYGEDYEVTVKKFIVPFVFLVIIVLIIINPIKYIFWKLASIFNFIRKLF
jgi:hypothetical protein